MRPYKVLVTHQVLTMSKPSSRDRERIIRYLDSLANDPFQNGDYQEQDAVGRPIQIKVVGEMALTYWVDHGSEEVKVTHIEKADQK